MARTLEEWLVWQQGVHPAGMALGLERVREAAQRLGLAAPAARTIIVAGTNGKGSTVAFIEAMARAAGWRTGAYTSPHLRRYTERLRIDGREADEARLIDAFERIEAARGDLPLTYFEYGTLAALMLLEAAEVDLAVLEVGLGGRLDAVNLVDADVAVLTSVDLDHAEYLGEDRESIGVEKAGVFRAGRPAVLAERLPPGSVLGEIERIGARAVRAGLDFRATPLPGGGWRYQDAQGAFDLPAPALIAPCQRDNAAAALAALRQLPASPALPPISPAAVADALRTVRLPGRMQRLPGPVEVLLDVAHNPQAARQLADWLAANPVRGATHAVFSALADKDIPHIVAALMGRVDVWRLAGLPEVRPRGLDVDGLWRRVAGLLSRTLSTRHASVAEAMTETLAQAAAGDRVVVFGSFHTVGEALDALGVDQRG
ncbi:MAG: bifunctional tetrahydrofolate synthase/dihydrofolate synthase [Lysobacteraceae bacterium]